MAFRVNGAAEAAAGCREAANCLLLTTVSRRKRANCCAWTTASPAKAPAGLAKAPASRKKRAASLKKTPAKLAEAPAKAANHPLRGQLDPLMNRYRLTNAAFFAAYRTARALVDRHGGGGTPAALEIGAAVQTGPTAAKLIYATTGGAGAVTIVVEWKGPAEADFGHATAVVRPEQTLTNAAFAGATVAFRTKATDAVGNETLSAVQTVLFA